MERIKSNLDRVKELETLLEVSERKSDVLTNLLKEASVEFEHTLEQIKISESIFAPSLKTLPRPSTSSIRIHIRFWIVTHL